MKTFWALGLMSGTSLDGIDAALVQSDGERILARGPWLTQPYDEGLRHCLRDAVYGRGDREAAARDMTLAHAEAVAALLKQTDIKPDVIGFHGQSVDHRPAEGITLQIGDPALLAEKTGVNVVADFRRRDVAAGGQGAPLVPLFHAAMVADLPKPVAVLNIGGIANVTWVGCQPPPVASLQSSEAKRQSEQGEARSGGGSASDGGKAPLNILALDTGPGNVLLNEWLGHHTGTHCDTDGALAQQGWVDEAVLELYLQDPFFARKPPKSLDRNYFPIDPVWHLSPEDGAATLTAFTVRSIARARQWFPEPPKQWIVAGGGRHNPVIMKGLERELRELPPEERREAAGRSTAMGEASPPTIQSAEQAGWEGDALEAQAFGFLAVRSLLGLPLSLPTITGVNRAVTGGALWRAVIRHYPYN